MRRFVCAVIGLVLLSGCGSGAAATPSVTAAASMSPAASTSATAIDDWPLFGITKSRLNATDRATGVTASTLRSLRRRQVTLPGTVDSSPIMSGGVVFVTTTYGKTLAISPASGRIKWTFTPPGYDGWKGSAQITNASPAADPSGDAIFAASPDGKIHKLNAADGREMSGFPVALTKDPTHEKLTSSINVSGANVIATTGGYIGDAPPYQGKVVTLDRGSGAIRGVFNSLCSDRAEIIAPSSCSASDSAIWGRSGAVVLPGSGDLLVATSNGPFDGVRNWGDSVLRLDPTATKLLTHWTPSEQKAYEEQDVDVGSVSPALLGGDLIMQSGKDAKMHVLSLSRMYGVTGAAGAKLGGDLQVLATPGKQMMFSAPAVWHHGGRTTLFATTAGGTAAYRVKGRRLVSLWSNGNGGTSPVLAGGLLYVYDPDGGLRVYSPTTGRTLKVLDAGSGHWNSPIVARGFVVLPEGNANDHATTGTLDIWSRR